MPMAKKKCEKSRNNSVARRGPGAPKGNRNALRHGRYTAAHLARVRARRAELRQLKALAAGFKALGAEPELLAEFASRIALAQMIVRLPPKL